ncbi:MAG: SulP family inorganic anion transporter [Flavobacteriales bacterium]|jgi:MFS superfamily sulfate permease-like transporter|nr:SulP family inorganic anion transporter [Flavobacteriales bacterium]MBK6893991.1 SulP family inorganic anion transporter [Flavobacteriales bacterium]MBK7247939.1 SulP family inorganic anion transporter [Flavobacteriales bacterium]MBK9060856.1 SulP family inorganic anion transporter [Flavobacteriales bacterium]MBK9599006.1 SulP family inorganic anion transporter [Flavobacteriales bacterium]
MNNLFGSVKRDLPASIVVFLVAVPLCLGIALASGAPPFAGLLAGVIGGLVVGAASGSQLGVSGPAAGLAAIVLTSVAALGSFQLFLLAVLLAGIIQFLMGLARGGVIAYFFPSAVIKGMLAGIGIFIALTQFPHAFGHDKERATDSVVPRAEGGVFGDLVNMFAAPHFGALIIAAACFAVLLLWESPSIKRNKVLSMVPGPLLAVIIGITLAALGGIVPLLSLSANHFVQLPDLSGVSLGSLFPGPDWSGISNMQVWTTALTLALVASLETLLSVEAADKLDPQKRETPKNRELMAQGFGNVVAGLLGALPVTQVIVRSSANVQSGGRTKLSGMLHGLWVLVAVLLFPTLLGMIPLAALAAILVQVGFKLARPALFTEMWQGGWTRFTPFLVTVLGVVFLDLLKGVGLGMAVALFIILRNNYKVPFHLLERSVSPGEPVRLALGEEASFLNKASIQRTLAELPTGSHIIIDVSRTVRLDPDIHEILTDGQTRAKNKGSIVEIIGIDAHRRHRVAAWLSVKHVRETFHFVSSTPVDPARP